MKATRARLMIGDVAREQGVDATATHTRFSLDLKAGDYDLQTWLTINNRAVGALFVTVTARGPGAGNSD